MQMLKMIIKVTYKILHGACSISDALWNCMAIKMGGCVYDAYPKISGRIFLKNLGVLKIGNNVVINSKLGTLSFDNGTTTSIRVMHQGVLIIENDVGMSNVSICCSLYIKIGKGVFIGRGCEIFDTDFHSLNWRERISERYGEENNVKRLPIIINQGCFIGAKTLIMKGVEIGEQTVIGAGSVVTKSIPSKQVWAGNPARFIRKLTDSEIS